MQAWIRLTAIRERLSSMWLLRLIMWDVISPQGKVKGEFLNHLIKAWLVRGQFKHAWADSQVVPGQGDLDLARAAN
eukprot:970078-Amphidinium_carterae.1